MMSRRSRRMSWITCLAIVWAASMCGFGESADFAPVRFGLMTDLHAHDLDSPAEGKWMRNTALRVSAFTAAMNSEGVDFVIQLGDFVNGWVVFGAEPGDPRRIPAILSWADSLLADFAGPRYHVIGNHDVYNLDKEMIRALLGMERTSYSFDVGAFHFVVLDLQYDNDGRDLAHTYAGVSGCLPPSLLSWLRDDLAAHAGRPTIVCVHQPLDEFVVSWGRPLVSNQEEIQRTLEGAGNVIAVLQGHSHAFRHTVVGGIHYVTFEALVDQGTPPSWAVLTLDPITRSIRIDGAGDQPNVTLSYADSRLR